VHPLTLPDFDQRDADDPSFAHRAITLAVFAPLDKEMSHYPTQRSQLPDINASDVVRRLFEVSKKNVHVTALIDRTENCSWQIDIPPNGPMQITLLNKIDDMSDPRHLSDLVHRAMTANPSAQVALCLEGHGAGYVPDVDTRRLTEQAMASLNQSGVVRWQILNESLTPDGRPILPMVHPVSSAAPAMVANLGVLSTWGIGDALGRARARPDVEKRKIAVIHFNNCFNMAVEVLHTVAPHAHYAVGYMNYNFFSACESYPAVFEKLRAMSNPRVSDLATLFAEHNRLALKRPSASDNNENPTTGAVIALRRMPGIAEAINAFAKQLIDALPEPKNVQLIQGGIEASQQYDTGGDGSPSPEKEWALEVPDQLTDIRHFAKLMSERAKSIPNLAAAAHTLYTALDGIKQYGEEGRPWVGRGAYWSFKDTPLAMNIFCPDPSRTGLWDWRAPYYLLGNEPTLLNVIPFLASNAWVQFIIEYHRNKRFKKYLPIEIARYPMKKDH
jgi:hypothetical protein